MVILNDELHSFSGFFLPELWQIASNLNPPKECGIDCCAAIQNWFLKYNNNDNREREDRDILYKGANELTKRALDKKSKKF